MQQSAGLVNNLPKSIPLYVSLAELFGPIFLGLPGACAQGRGPVRWIRPRCSSVEHYWYPVTE